MAPGEDAKKANGDDSSIIIIAPKGDVIFVVGPEKRMMRVQSVLFRMASPVFDAMLGPNYSEGKNLDPLNPKEIALPEDDADALEVIFNAIHYRMDDIPDPLDPSLVLQVALSADKYNFIQSLKLHARAWLASDKLEDPTKLWKQAISASWFQDEDAFQKATRSLLLSYDKPYMTLGKVDMMPPTIAGQLMAKMESVRSILRWGLIARIMTIGIEHAPGLPCYHGNSQCSFGKLRGLDFMKAMFRDRGKSPYGTYGPLHPTNVQRVSVRSVLAGVRVDRIQPLDTSNVRCGKGSGVVPVHPDFGFSGAIQEAVSGFMAEVQGLSLSSMLDKPE